MMIGQNDYNNKDFMINKTKYFYLAYSIYDLFLNIYGFKFSLINYPYNHFKQNNCNIYFLNKDFNLLELFSLNGSLLIVQVKPDNSLYIEFRYNINVDISGNNSNNRGNYLDSFIGEIKKKNFNYNIFGRDYNKVIIIIDDNDNSESIGLIEKLKNIVNIFISFSK